MVIEHALLSVIPGRETEFLTAFGAARSIIAAMPGFRDLRLSRSIEQPNQFLLLVEWNQLTDHTVGFRGSAQYQEWKALLHHFYDPFPEVSHFIEVTHQP
jgi:heme-degrading monooxygenase HmoA